MSSRWRHSPKTVSPRPYCRSRRGRNGLGSETITMYNQHRDPSCHRLELYTAAISHNALVLYGHQHGLSFEEYSLSMLSQVLVKGDKGRCPNRDSGSNYDSH